MFNKNRLPFAAATRLGNKLLEMSRSRYFMFATFMVLLLGVASPAQAVEATIATATTPPDYMCFIGSPSLEPLEPAQAAFRTITGIILGIALLGGAIFMIVAGIRIVLAGKDPEKASQGISQAKHVVLGVAVIFGGLLIFGLIVAVLVGIVPFGC